MTTPFLSPNASDIQPLGVASPGSSPSAASATHVHPTTGLTALQYYAPTGLTGATAPTRYAGGTASGHPLTGTFAVGDWVVDQQGHIFACIAAGTPGTWRRVGKDPWQFFLDDYAKGDGQQALVTTAAASAVINTTPLAAPAAPTLANAATGGTVQAGVYQVIVTYVNRWGETVGSVSASTTTAGTTSTITISSPVPSGGATGWYAYVTAPGGSTYFRQQVAGAPTLINAKLVLTAPPTTSGANPPGSDSSAARVFTSTAVDGGKNIMICGGLGSPGTPWVDTILSVQSPTQATLSTNGASQGGNVSQAGCAMVFASDDRLNVDQCITDAKTYALANSNFCQVIGSDKNYGLGTGFFQSVYTDANGPGLNYNAQVRIPTANQSGQTEKLEFQLLGPGANSHAEFWVSQYVNLNGCTFVSFSVGPATADPTYGQQCVISTPVGGVNFNGSAGFANVKAVIKGVQVIQPGWSNSIGIGLTWASGCEIHASSQAFAPATNSGGGINPSNNWLNNTFWQNKIGVGMSLPGQGNNDDVLIESFTSEGITTSLTSQADHAVITRLVTINTNAGIILGGSSNSHALTISQWSFENVNTALSAGNVGAGPIQVDITMDGENTSIGWDVYDPNNALTGQARWRDTFRSSQVPTVNGARNLNIINCSRGPALVPKVVTLTDAATIAVQADLGNDFRVTLGGNRTMGVPSNPQDGQGITFAIQQPASGGPWSVVFPAPLSAPTAPTLSSALTGGTVADGTYQAEITYINARGETVASASASITITGTLAAPAAPVPTTATTGGTVAAGTYQVVVTYVNANGETVGSAAGTVTTTGATSTITVPSPAASGNATGWYAYVSQAGGTAVSATRQQAAGSPTAIGTGLTLTAPPTNTGLTAPASNTTGNKNTLTVASPAAAYSATGWYAYVTQAGGSTYTRQQAAGSPTAVGTNLTLTAPPTNTGAAPPGSNTTGGGFSFGGAGAPALSTAASAVDLVGFKYHAGKGMWLCLGSAGGF